MAKKQTNEAEVAPEVKATEEVKQVVEKKPKRVEKKYKTLSDGWEIKNRIYR